jgi:hypothetical protein
MGGSIPSIAAFPAGFAAGRRDLPLLRQISGTYGINIPSRSRHFSIYFTDIGSISLFSLCL